MAARHERSIACSRTGSRSSSSPRACASAGACPACRSTPSRGFRDKQLMKERVAAAGLRVPRSRRVRTETRDARRRRGDRLPADPQADRRRRQRRHVQGASNAAELDADARDDARRRARRAARSTSRARSSPSTRCASAASPPTRTSRSTCRSRSRCARSSGSARSSSPCATWRSRSSQGGIALGRKVLDALGMGDGFTHMEWFLTPKGEAVFGEIGCRPGGAHLVDQMNYTCDIDLFREWARVACCGTFEARRAAQVQRRHRLQARARPGPHHAHRGARRVAAHVRRLRRRGEAPPPRHAAPQLEAHAALRRPRRSCATPTGTRRIGCRSPPRTNIRMFAG